MAAALKTASLKFPPSPASALCNDKKSMSAISSASVQIDCGLVAFPEVLLSGSSDPSALSSSLEDCKHVDLCIGWTMKPFNLRSATVSNNFKFHPNLKIPDSRTGSYLSQNTKYGSISRISENSICVDLNIYFFIIFIFMNIYFIISVTWSKCFFE